MAHDGGGPAASRRCRRMTGVGRAINRSGVPNRMDPVITTAPGRSGEPVTRSTVPVAGICGQCATQVLPMSGYEFCPSEAEVGDD